MATQSAMANYTDMLLDHFDLDDNPENREFIHIHVKMMTGKELGLALKEYYEQMIV